MNISAVREKVATFLRQIMEEMLCIPCETENARGDTIHASARFKFYPLELVDLDIYGKMTQKCLGDNIYAIGFIDDHTAKSDVHFFPRQKICFIKAWFAINGETTMILGLSLSRGKFR